MKTEEQINKEIHGLDIKIKRANRDLENPYCNDEAIYQQIGIWNQRISNLAWVLSDKEGS